MPETEEQEDLREHYITPAYLETMRARARYWSSDFIKAQLQHFKRTIPGYPEVHELLEAEVHRRNLNQLLRHIRRTPQVDLGQLLQKFGREPDYAEVIRTEMEIRQGVQRLTDVAEGQQARIV